MTGWKLVDFGRSDFVVLASMWVCWGVYWAHFVRGSESPWVPVVLAVGLAGFLCVMVCELAVIRRDSGGVYGLEVSPRGAPPDDALRGASAGEHLAGVVDEMFFVARRDVGAALEGFLGDVRLYRERRREERRERRERDSVWRWEP